MLCEETMAWVTIHDLRGKMFRSKRLMSDGLGSFCANRELPM